MLGAVAIPSSSTGDTFKVIQQKCADYAAAKALEDFRTSGKVSGLTSLQADIDDCTASMDLGRQIRQGLILVTGLGIAGYLGFLVWKR